MMVLKLLSQSCALILLLTVNNINGDSDDTWNNEKSRVDQLLERVNALEERESEQQRLIVDLKNELTKRDENHENAINNLQDELANMKKEIGMLKRSMIYKDRQIWKLLRSFTHKSRPCAKQNPMPTSEATATLSDDKAEGKKESGIVRSRRIENEVTVAFSAGLSKIISQPGINQSIVFDRVETNLGNGYNSHHGIFVAPVSGTYVFFTTMYASHAYSHDHIFCHFVVNGVAKSTLYVESTSSSSDTGSQMIITQLNKGDDVAVQLLDSVSGIYSNENLLSTFSGFLLQQEFLQSGGIVG